MAFDLSNIGAALAGTLDRGVDVNQISRNALTGAGRAEDAASISGSKFAGGGLVGDTLANVNSFISNNPDQFSFIADTIGQALDPNNPFAGAGTKIAQSSIAGKAADKQDKRSNRFMELLEMLAGKSGINSVESKTTDTGDEDFTLKGSLPGSVGSIGQALSGQSTGIAPMNKVRTL